MLILVLTSTWNRAQKVETISLDWSWLIRSGGSVVDNMLDYQFRDSKIDPMLLRSFGWDFEPRSRLHMTSLLVGR